MPNWCFTDYVFHGDKDEITKLYKTIFDATSKTFTKTDFGENWLGNVLYECGLENEIDKGLRCRGEITYLGEIVKLDSTDNSYQLSLQTETAWNYMPKMWLAIIKSLELKTVKFTFCAEECLSETYAIYDPYGFGDFPEEYIIEYCTPAAEETEYLTEQGAINLLQELLNSKISDINLLISMAEDYNLQSENYFINVHKYEIVSEL